MSIEKSHKGLIFQRSTTMKLGMVFEVCGIHMDLGSRGYWRVGRFFEISLLFSREWGVRIECTFGRMFVVGNVTLRFQFPNL